MESALSAANRSNQRGGRMLSIVDLIEAGTLTVTQAAWLLLRVLQGSSWLVGARPGGAGKTTIMSALLAMVPRGSRIWLTNHGNGWARCKEGEYVVSYELSPGFYDAYIWGSDVVRMTELGLAGCRIVSNLHADTLEQARAQIVEECGATEEGFRAFQLFIPLVVKGPGFSRSPVVEWIDTVGDGRWLRWRRGDAVRPDEDHRDALEQLSGIADFLAACRAGNLRLIEDVREAWIGWWESNNPRGNTPNG
jgi:hypothetical protein